VEKKALTLGMKVLLCDPPLRDATGNARYQSSLEEVLSADILSFHVPLTTAGPYPTYHMVDKSVLERLSPRQFLINTARGAVIAGPDLKSALGAGGIEGAALDVWEGEPEIDLSLLELAEIGTPHIAGYSIDGKIRATEMMFAEICRHFQLSVSWDTSALYPEAARIRPEVGMQGDEAIRSVVLQAYDILRDDNALRALRSLSIDRARAGFDRLRNEYPLRPEFRHFIVDLPKEQNGLAGIIGALGFLIAGVEGN
jgi:erythronate-4-phosphate dehydrogenase